MICLEVKSERLFGIRVIIQKEIKTASYKDVGYYKYPIDKIIFYTHKENGEIEKVSVPIFGLNQTLHFFFIKSDNRNNCIPIHRKETSITPKEEYCFIDNILYINANSVNFKGPVYYKKGNRPKNCPVNFDKNYYCLVINYTWEGDGFSRELWFDTTDYIIFQADYQKILQKIHPYSQFCTLEKIDEYINELEKFKQKLLARYEWWETATPEEIAQFYNSKTKRRDEE